MSEAPGSTPTDADLIRRALGLAARGPVADANPRVGAVITDAAGRVVGEGFHAGAGTPHAEVVALAAAGPSARGGSAYVSLEPCNHMGRTGACTQALVGAGIVRVVFAQSDPNPLAAGGAAALGAAGVQTLGGVLATEAAALNRYWTFAVTAGRPFVTWKFAATLDGRSAAADGSSRWITSAPAREDVHRLRGTSGAILVGTGTVLADNPQLTVRDAGGAALGRQPLRVVVGHRRLPPRSRVFDDQAETLVVATHDPTEVLDVLAAREIRHALLEGGPTLAAAFLRQRLVDEVVAYIAPALLGAGEAAVADFGVGGVEEILRIRPTDVALLGGDVRLTGLLMYRTSPDA